MSLKYEPSSEPDLMRVGGQLAAEREGGRADAEAHFREREALLIGQLKKRC